MPLVVGVVLAANKAKRKTAVMVELDIESLKASKKRKEDIEKAVKGLMESDRNSLWIR